MDNFDYKKYLAEGKLTEAYTPGSGWTEDFEYDDMMAHGLTLTADDSIEDLRKVVEDFTDVNYHREAAHLYDAIDSIEAGNRGEAEMYIDKFRKEIKNTLAGWDDVNEAQEDEDYDTGGYVEAMNPELFDHIDEVIRIFKEWKDGPMTEPGMEGYAKDDLVDYIQMKIRNA